MFYSIYIVIILMHKMLVLYIKIMYICGIKIEAQIGFEIETVIIIRQR